MLIGYFNLLIIRITSNKRWLLVAIGCVVILVVIVVCLTPVYISAGYAITNSSISIDNLPTVRTSRRFTTTTTLKLESRLKAASNQLAQIKELGIQTLNTSIEMTSATPVLDEKIITQKMEDNSDNSSSQRSKFYNYLRTLLTV